MGTNWFLSLLVSIYFMVIEKIKNFAGVQLLVAFAFVSCIGGHAPQAPSEASIPAPPHHTYVQLEKRLMLTLGESEVALASWGAGGVCVQEADGGCFVLSADHFCNPDMEEALGPVPEGYSLSSDLRFAFHGTNVFGKGGDAYVVAQMPEADLCLLWVEGEMFSEIEGIQSEETIPEFAVLQNWGAPNGFFRPYPQLGLLFGEGRWSGYCGEFCRLSSETNYESFIMHSIPTSKGQSGSAVFYGVHLFAIQVASDLSVQSFGIATRSSIIREFLLENNIDRPYR